MREREEGAFILPYEPLGLEISRLSQFICSLRNIVFIFPLHKLIPGLMHFSNGQLPRTSKELSLESFLM